MNIENGGENGVTILLFNREIITNSVFCGNRCTVTALNVTDTAIILLNGQYGVEVGTQNHFRYTEKLNKPVIFLVNQLDNEKCDYDNILEQLKEAYGSKVVPIQYPISTGPLHRHRIPGTYLLQPILYECLHAFRLPKESLVRRTFPLALHHFRQQPPPMLYAFP